MKNNRTNFKVMKLSDFISYLSDNNIEYNSSETTDNSGLKVITITPNHFRLLHRSFNVMDEKQISSSRAKTRHATELRSLITLIDKKVENMATKSIYFPKRLKPFWKSLATVDDKLKHFERYVSDKDASIGFLKLVKMNLCEKTLESVVIEYPVIIEYLKNKETLRICIEKFDCYEHGKIYLARNNIKT